MAKEKAPRNPYPIPVQHQGYEYGDNYFTNPALVADERSSLRPYVPGENPTRDEQIRTVSLQERHRISHPNVARRMVTTAGKPNEDPMGEMRVSRNDKVHRARDSYYPLTPEEADEYNTKLLRDQEEIDLSLEDLDAIERKRVETQAALDKKKLFGVHALSVILGNLSRDEEYLQNRVTWLSGLSDSVGRGANLPEFDAQAVRDEHDNIMTEFLYRPSKDGSRGIDQLHEYAAGEAQQALRASGRQPLNGYDQGGRYIGSAPTEQNSDKSE